MKKYSIHTAVALLLLLIAMLTGTAAAQAPVPEVLIDLSTSGSLVTINDASRSYRIVGTGGSVYVEATGSDPVHITLDNATLKGQLKIKKGVSVNLHLIGDNIVNQSQYATAGISKAYTEGNLVIDGSGSLTAVGGQNSAGIGVGYDDLSSNDSYLRFTGNITINSGTIIATGGSFGAGIGGGRDSGLIGLTINGGSVTATGGSYAAGIGGGGSLITDMRHGALDLRGSSITINGGSVQATGGYFGAGIGGGGTYGVVDKAFRDDSFAGTGIYITITGGSGTIEGGSDAPGIGGGATISGRAGDCAYVSISGGTWEIEGGMEAAAIGHGNAVNRYSPIYSFGETRNLTISGGNIHLVKSYSASHLIGGQDELPGGGVVASDYGTCHAFAMGADEEIVNWVSSSSYSLKDVTPLNGYCYFWLKGDSSFHTLDSAGTVHYYSTIDKSGLQIGDVVSSTLDVTALGELLLLPGGYVDLSVPNLFHPISNPGSYTLTGGTAAAADADAITLYGDMNVNLSNIHLNANLTQNRGVLNINTTGRSTIDRVNLRGSANFAGGGTLSLGYIYGNNITVSGGSILLGSLSGAENFRSKDGKTLFRHTFAFGAELAGKPVSFTNLPSGYLGFGITTDDNGDVALWLPTNQPISATTGGVTQDSEVWMIKGYTAYVYAVGGNVITLKKGMDVDIYPDLYAVNYPDDDTKIPTIYTYTGDLTLTQAAPGAVNASAGISAEGDYTITLDNLNLSSNRTLFSCGSNANVTLLLKGNNFLTSQNNEAIYKGATGTLTITGGGFLEARGGSAWYGDGAGIGGLNAANITIRGCTVNAFGGLSAAGIGGSEGTSVSGYHTQNILIESATVHASGITGIGGGATNYNLKEENLGSVSNIVIHNSDVTATGTSGAGIGGGPFYRYAEPVNGITIENSEVTASSIGGGVGSNWMYHGRVSGVFIKNSVVNCSTIGGAYYETTIAPVEVRLEDSTVFADILQNNENRITVDGGSFKGNRNLVAKDSGGNTLYRHTLVFDQPGKKVTFLSGLPEGYKAEHVYTDENNLVWLWLPQNGCSITASTGENTLSFEGRSPWEIQGVVTVSGTVTIALEGSSLVVTQMEISPAAPSYSYVWEMSYDGEYFYPYTEISMEEWPMDAWKAQYQWRVRVSGSGIYDSPVYSNVLGPFETTPVTGAVSIAGTVAAGQTVAADLSGVLPAGAAEGVNIQWYTSASKEGSGTKLSEGLSLTLGQENIGQYLYCELNTVFPYEGTLTSQRILIDRWPISGIANILGDNFEPGSYLFVEYTDLLPEDAETNLTYRWERVKNGVVTDLGITTSFYQIQEADRGCEIRAVVLGGGNYGGSIFDSVEIPDPTLNRISVYNAAMEGNSVSFRMTNHSTREKCLVIIASYNSSGRLQMVDTREVSLCSGKMIMDLTEFADESDIRLYFVEEESTRPLCAPLFCPETLTS